MSKVLELELDPKRMPRHIAFIMDGNRRWAKERFLPSVMGHQAGVKAFRVVLETCRQLGIEYVSAYAFSAENWRRTPGEVKILMHLFEHYAQAERRSMVENGIRLRVIGDKGGLDPAVCRELELSEEATAHNRALTLNLAVNYGGREELTQAARQLAQRAAAGELEPRDIDEELLASQLYTAGSPDPDLLVRTSGELRLSNFLLWQLAYAEFYFSDLYWPEVDANFVYQAIGEYQRRLRRYGA